MSPAEQTNQTKNALGIAFVTGGPSKLRAKLNEIISGFNYVILRNSADIIGDVSSLGTLAKLRTPQQSGRTAGQSPKAPLAWDVSVSGDPAVPSNSLLSVWPGTVNGLIADNYAAHVSVATAGTFYLSAHVTTSTQSVTGVTITSAASAPISPVALKNALPNTLDILFAVVIKGAAFQIRRGNITISPQEVFRLEKTVPVPGGMPFDTWWNWSLSP